MNKNFLITLISTVLFFPVSEVHAQDANSRPRMEVTEVYVMGGYMGLSSNDQTLSTFRKLAPSSEILSRDLSDYDNYSNFLNPGLGVFNANVAIKFNKSDGVEKNGPLVRLGITYQGGTVFRQNINFELRTPYDTLVSSQTGEEEYRDSIYTSDLEMKYLTSQVLADVSVIWRTNPDFRWGVYGGIGAAGGLSFDNRTVIEDRKNYFTSSDRGYDYPSASEKEVFDNENAYSALVYLPLGANFTLGKNNFWGLINLVVEFRPAISIISVPEIETDISAAFPFSCGLKVSW